MEGLRIEREGLVKAKAALGSQLEAARSESMSELREAREEAREVEARLRAEFARSQVH